MNTKTFNVTKGDHYSLLETKSYGEIVFGCPPDIVKEFMRAKKPLPSKYVFPSKTFNDGQNHFDFEFIIYSFLFTRAKGSIVNAYCRPTQEKQIKAILNETLFGPRFDQIIEAQNYKLINNKKFSSVDKKRFKLFQHKYIAKNNILARLFNDLIKDHASNLNLTKAIKKYFEDNILAKQKWLNKKHITSLSLELTKNYLLCAQLRKEMQLFSLSKESQRNKFISKIINFHHISASGLFFIPDKNNLKFLQLKEEDQGIFIAYEKNIAVCTVNLGPKPRKSKLKNIKPFKKPRFGITFLGVGSGFSQSKQNSSTIIWSENKGILIDVVADHTFITKKHGINNDDIKYIFLTHVHSDHDSGILEKILQSQQTNLITSRIIYESFLRKAAATTSLSKKTIESYISFKEVEPNKKIKLPGFTRTFFEFDYSLHSIPSGRCKITYIDGSLKKSISLSGDTKYDVQKINAWHENGDLTTARKNSLTGFIWNSDLIVHDIGGGNLHTKHDALLFLPNKIKKKVILVHQNEKSASNSPFRYAKDGESISLIRK